MQRESPTDATVTIDPSMITKVTVVPDIWAAIITCMHVRKHIVHACTNIIYTNLYEEGY